MNPKDSENPTRLSGRTVLVTGASSGIGRAVARRLLDEGARVIGVARRFVEAGPGPGLEGMEAVGLDLGELDSLERALPALAKRYGEVDAVVCNAGRGRFGGLEEFSYRQVRELVDLNLTGQIFLARAFLPTLRERAREGGGSDLVFVGSEAAVAGGARGAVYSATKFALRGLAQALRQECAGSGTRVSSVHPGMVRTEFFDELDFEPGPDEVNALAPEDVAEAVAMILAAPPRAVFDEIRLSPLKKVVRRKGSRKG